jgi:hypothetical protein
VVGEGERRRGSSKQLGGAGRPGPARREVRAHCWCRFGSGRPPLPGPGCKKPRTPTPSSQGGARRPAPPPAARTRRGGSRRTCRWARSRRPRRGRRTPRAARRAWWGGGRRAHAVEPQPPQLRPAGRSSPSRRPPRRARARAAAPSPRSPLAPRRARACARAPMCPCLPCLSCLPLPAQSPAPRRAGPPWGRARAPAAARCSPRARAPGCCRRGARSTPPCWRAAALERRGRGGRGRVRSAGVVWPRSRGAPDASRVAGARRGPEAPPGCSIVFSIPRGAGRCTVMGCAGSSDTMPPAVPFEAIVARRCGVQVAVECALMAGMILVWHNSLLRISLAQRGSLHDDAS